MKDTYEMKDARMTNDDVYDNKSVTKASTIGMHVQMHARQKKAQHKLTTTTQCDYMAYAGNKGHKQFPRQGV